MEGPTLLWWMLLLACDGEPDPTSTETESMAPTGDTAVEGWLASFTLDNEVTDECEALCGLLVARHDGIAAAWQPYTVEGEVDGFVATGTLDGDGEARVCLTGLSVGEQALVLRVGDVSDETMLSSSVDVRPFGWSFGLDKPVAPLEAVPWTPEFSQEALAADPVLSPDDTGWDSMSVMMPSTVELGGTRLVYYAGTDEEVFHLGAASDDGDGLVKYESNPILEGASLGAVEGDWNYYAQNTPEAVLVDDEVWLYYNGRMGTTGGLVIGLATSTDGLEFTNVEDNPLFEPTGVDGDFDEGAVAHPSVRVVAPDFDLGHDRVFELWYASGTLEIGYALSTDGIEFTRYCNGAVFSGEPSSWDDGHVKAPEVVHDGEHYLMSYSGCGQGCYQVGWAASSDGIRWVTADEPIIPVQEPPAWNSFGTQSAYVEVDGDTWRLWYAGSGTSSAAVGMVETTRD